MARMQPLGRSLEKITKNRKELNKKILGTRKEILKIKFSKDFKLSEEYQKNYDSWKDIGEERKRDFAHSINLPKNEKDYAIRVKKNKISLYKQDLKFLICEEKGHKESVISLGNQGTYVECKRCRTSYTRSMNIDESNDWTKMLNTPMTI